MRKTFVIALGAVSLAACGAENTGDPPSENSPVNPEVVCEETEQVNMATSECVKAEAEVAEDMNLPAGN